MISIVIPIYNERENINDLHSRLCKAKETWKEKAEIIYINDGSTDESLEIMKSIVARNQDVRVINLSRNFGHQASITAGLSHANGEAVIIMDGDLQDPPEEIERLINEWRLGYDIVYAIRKKRKENIIMRILYTIFYRLLRLLSDIKIPLDSGDFCLMSRRVVRIINQEMPETIRFVRGLRAFAGFKQIGIEYERSSRAMGKTKYSFIKLMNLALDGLFGFSTFPLRIAILLGIMIAVPSCVMGLIIFSGKIFNFAIFGRTPGAVPGFTTLAIGMFFLGGIILIFMGVIGEYIGRIYYEVKRRPTYIIESEYSSEGNKKKE